MVRSFLRSRPFHKQQGSRHNFKALRARYKETLYVNTRGLMPRFPWVRFLKHLTRISSNLSHLSLVGVEVSTKQFDMLLNACSALTHLKVEYFVNHFSKPAGHSSLKCLELYIDNLDLSYNFFGEIGFEGMLNNWMLEGCYPNHFIISFAGDCYSFDWYRYYSLYSLCDDIRIPPEAEGKFSIMSCNGCELVIKDCKVNVLVTSCSAITSLPIPLVQSLTKVCARIDTSSFSPDKCLELPFYDVGPTITHLLINDYSLDEIAYNFPSVKYLFIERCPEAKLSGLASISEKCLQLEGLHMKPGCWSADQRCGLLDILLRIRNLSYLTIDLCNLPLDCDLQQKKLERLQHLEVFVDDNATNEQLTALGQLVSTRLKRLWIKSYSDSSLGSRLRNLLFSLPNLQCLSLYSYSRIMDILNITGMKYANVRYSVLGIYSPPGYNILSPRLKYPGDKIYCDTGSITGRPAGRARVIYSCACALVLTGLNVAYISIYGLDNLLSLMAS